MRHPLAWSVLSLILATVIGCGSGDHTAGTGSGGGGPTVDASTGSGGAATGGAPADGGGTIDAGGDAGVDAADTGTVDAADTGTDDAGGDAGEDAADTGTSDAGGDAGEDAATPLDDAGEDAATVDDAGNPADAGSTTSDAGGTADAGAPCSSLDCDDGDPCTKDTCVQTTGCSHTLEPAGTACDDGIACTTNDVCTAQGACAGTVTAGCTATSCTTPSPLSGTIDIPVAETTATITLGGQPLPATDEYGAQIEIYLVAKDTGQWHTLATFDYNSSLFGPTVTPRVVPGVYDVYYCHGCATPAAGGISDETDATDAFPSGLRVLQSDVVVGAGPNALQIDIPVTHTTGTITLGGQPLPATDEYGAQIEIYLVAEDTGQWHTFATFDYNSNLFGPTINPLVVPGVYDVYYCHGCATPAAGGIADETDSTDAFPSGLRVLQTGLTVPAGSANLSIDIPVTHTTGTITLGGQPLPATDEYGAQIEIYLVSKDTGQWHTFATFDYNSNLFGPTINPLVVPGVYDVYYCHGCATPAAGGIADETDSTDAFPSGLRVLQTGLTVPAGSANLSIDIPVTHTTGTITLGGQPLPATDEYGAQIEIYLVSKDTGQWHTFATFDYNSNLFGPTINPLVVPGVYDVYYCHGCATPAAGGISDETDATDAFPSGLRVLQTGVTVPAGSANLSIDIPVTHTTGTITLGGQPLPATDEYGAQIEIYLVAKDTGQWHTFATFDYNSNLFGPTINPLVVPGVYDVYYCHGCASPAAGGIADETDSTDAFPSGLRVLQSGVTVPAGSANLSIDIPVAAVMETVTLGEQTLPATDEYGAQIELYLVSRDTGQWHTLATFDYNSSLFGPTVTPRVVPGTYDVYYCHGCATPGSGGIASETDATDAFPTGLRVLDACVAVP